MYFKLYQIDEQCQKYAMIGLVPFFGQYFLEEGDEGFERYQKEHYVEVPLIEGKYEGKVDEMGRPSDIDDYNKWISSFKTEWRWTPFVTQQILFEIAHVDLNENILFCFDWGLSLQAKNWLDGEIKSIAPIPYKQRIEEYSKNLVAKESTINLAYSKAVECQSVDFASLSVAKDYRVK